jgi:hypothetical protein
LLDEIREDLTDAVRAELDAGLDSARAEAAVLARFGDVSTVAARWNSDQAKRSVALRRNVALALAAAVAAGALGVAQLASGKSPPERVKGCARASAKLPCPEP